MSVAGSLSHAELRDSTPPHRPFTGFWVALLCASARRAPWLVRLLRPLAIHVTWLTVGAIRRNTIANARGLLGPDASRRECARIGRGVIASFHEFIFELAQLSHMTVDEARARVRSVEGRERYKRLRAEGRGVIIVTAHLGSFEVALSALAEVEPRLHVVYRRDEMGRFEDVRTSFRSRLGVRECPIEGGLPMWASLKDALRQGSTVLVQGDRVVEGQPGVPVRFGAGQLRAPVGPVKLARLTGAPLLPIVSIRESDGSIRILIGHPIRPPEVAAEDAVTLQRVLDALGAFVQRHPEQWLTLHGAFLDASSEGPHVEPPTT